MIAKSWTLFKFAGDTTYLTETNLRPTIFLRINENDQEGRVEEDDGLTRTKLTFYLVYFGIFGLHVAAFIAFICLSATGAAESEKAQTRTTKKTEWTNDLEDKGKKLKVDKIEIKYMFQDSHVNQKPWKINSNNDDSIFKSQQLLFCLL